MRSARTVGQDAPPGKDDLALNRGREAILTVFKKWSAATARHYYRVGVLGVPQDSDDANDAQRFDWCEAELR